MSDLVDLLRKEVSFWQQELENTDSTPDSREVVAIRSSLKLAEFKLDKLLVHMQSVC